MKKGFSRLKGVAAASVMGVGFMAAGSGRAVSLPSNSRWLGTSIRTTLAATISDKGLSATIQGIGGSDTSQTFEIGGFMVNPTSGTLYNKFASSLVTHYVRSTGTWIPTNTRWTVTSSTVTGPGWPSCLNGTVSNSSAANTVSGSFTNNACWWTTTGTTTWDSVYSISTWMSTSTHSVGSHAVTAGGSSNPIAYSDAFDGVLGMSVDGTVFKNPDGTLDFTGDVVTSDPVTFAGNIDAKIEYAFDGSRGGTSVGGFRAMYTLINNSGAEKEVTVNIFGDLASDKYTTIQATESGDLLSDDADKWTVSSEMEPGVETILGWTPTMLVTRYGTGATVVPAQTSVLGEGDAVYTNKHNDAFANEYVLTIPAGETQRILVFIEAHMSNAGAEAAAADFESLTAAKNAGALEGLTTDQLKEVVNYKYVAPSSSDSGAFGLSALFALFGIPALLRRFRKDK